ncbi:MAG TPA: acyltransferase family protein [Acidimicrobiales bacterium]|jgi:peptidoglycan/LPS O-acetylase OafA/YrhL|nr:acyltransferase family protein [Acidimicrobiales bacterium]
MQDDESAVSHTRLAYLPALDGMRACAVLAVMMFHGGIPHMDGGFMGVDAFFVLSGFLITSLLIGEWRQALTIKLGAFWARRARRLLPALLLMLLLVAFFASVIVPKGTYGALRLDALATLLYVSNWHFILVNSNYFNETSASSPLLHTWSLAVEEQFYVIWPLVVLAVLHVTRSMRALFALCCAAAIGSAVWMYHVYDGGANTNRAYLGTDTRSQCLFIGCALAVGLVLMTQRSHEEGRLVKGELWRPQGSTGRVLCAVLGVIGAAGAIGLWVLTTSTSTFPYSGGFFLIGLSVAAIILAAVAAPRSVVPWLLSLSAIRYVGRISYGLYIYHWPLFIWIDHSRTGLSGYSLFGFRVLVTFAVSVVSFHLVERPIRMGTFVSQWRAWLVVPAGVGAVVVAVIAATTGTTALASTALPGGTGGTGGTGTTGNTGSAAATSSTTLPPASAAGPPVKVLLFGDSVALTLGLGLGLPAEQDKYGYTLADKGILGCGVVDGPEVEIMGARDSVAAACNGAPTPAGAPAVSQPWPTQWQGALAAEKPNVAVLLAGRWEVVDREYKGSWTNILHPAYAAYVKSQLELASQLVTATGAHMVFLTGPCTNEGEQPDGAAWPEDNPARLAVYNKLMREVAAEYPTTDTAVDLFGPTCPGGKFATTVHGVTIREPDGVHFTVAGGQYVAPSIMPAIVAAGRAQMAAGAAVPPPTSAGG